MLKAYRIICRTIINGKCVSSDSGMTICESSNTLNRSTAITWENVEEKFLKNSWAMGFGLLCRRKGKVIYYNDGQHFIDRRIKEWKTPVLDIQLVVEYKESKISMRDLMNYHDADIALQYMKERGIAFNSMGK